MPTTYYTNANGMILGERTGNGPHIDYIPDALGSVVAAVDQNLVTTYTAAYSPFGDVIASTGTAPNVTWAGTLGYLQSAGRPYAEYSVRARFYSGSTGRWASVDRLWPMLQPYIYAAQSPTKFVDRTGDVCSKTPSPSITVANFGILISTVTATPKYNGGGFWGIMAYLDLSYLCIVDVSPCWPKGCTPIDCVQVPMPQWWVKSYNFAKPGQWGPDNGPKHDLTSSSSCGCPVYSSCNTTQEGYDCPGWSTCQFIHNGPTVSCDAAIGPYPINESQMCPKGEFCQYKAWFRSCCAAPWPTTQQPPDNCGNMAPLKWGMASSFKMITPGKQVCICLQDTDGNLSDYATPCDDYSVCSK